MNLVFKKYIINKLYKINKIIIIEKLINNLLNFKWFK